MVGRYRTHNPTLPLEDVLPKIAYCGPGLKLSQTINLTKAIILQGTKLLILAPDRKPRQALARTCKEMLLLGRSPSPGSYL